MTSFGIIFLIYTHNKNNGYCSLKDFRVLDFDNDITSYTCEEKVCYSTKNMVTILDSVIHQFSIVLGNKKMFLGHIKLKVNFGQQISVILPNCSKNHYNFIVLPSLS